jgi:hypothetical protein
MEALKIQIICKLFVLVDYTLFENDLKTMCARGLFANNLTFVFGSEARRRRAGEQASRRAGEQASKRASEQARWRDGEAWRRKANGRAGMVRQGGS